MPATVRSKSAGASLPATALNASAPGPPLAAGGVTLLLAVGVSAWLAQRMSRRLRSVQQQVADIAAGRLRWREDVVQGLAQAPAAFSGLLEGRNFGKLVIALD